jgi:hypothetical protein
MYTLLGYLERLSYNIAKTVDQRFIKLPRFANNELPNKRKVKWKVGRMLSNSKRTIYLILYTTQYESKSQHRVKYK